MTEARVVKLYTRVEYIKSQLTDDKPPLKSVWSGLRDPFSLLTPTIISLESPKRVSPNSIQL